MSRLPYRISAMALFAAGACTVMTSTGTRSQPANPPVQSQPGATSAEAPATSPEAAPTMAGLTLRQQEHAEQQNTSFQTGYIDDFNKRCEGQIDAAIDWQSFAGQIDRVLDGDLNVAMSSFCGEALGAMAGMCANNEGSKARIRESVLRYTCVYTDGSRTINLDGNHLQMSVDWEGPNYGKWVEDYLGRTL